jgi:hypothetical protein
MQRNDRIQLIRDIEKLRGSRVVVYVAGDRRGLETQIAADIFPFFLEHLARMGPQEKIDLYLYSTGGITMAGYGMVNLMKEFCKSFNVIVPFKAFSCATLVALGADEIVMTKMAQLSPIDPSIQSPLGPQVPIPGQPGATQVVPLSVEDAMSFLDLAKKYVGSDEDNTLMAKMFEKLSDSVHPLALGAVNRVREQIGFLASTLLSTHIGDKKRVDKIVETLIRGRFSHDYLISRKEAKNVIQLPVGDVSTDLEEKIVSLYSEYNALLQLSVPYHPEIVLAGNEKNTGTFTRAIIESTDLTHVFRTVREVKRITVAPPLVPSPMVSYVEQMISEGWFKDESL